MVVATPRDPLLAGHLVLAASARLLGLEDSAVVAADSRAEGSAGEEEVAAVLGEIEAAVLGEAEEVVSAAIEVVEEVMEVDEVVSATSQTATDPQTALRPVRVGHERAVVSEGVRADTAAATALLEEAADTATTDEEEAVVADTIEAPAALTTNRWAESDLHATPVATVGMAATTTPGSVDTRATTTTIRGRVGGTSCRRIGFVKIMLLSFASSFRVNEGKTRHVRTLRG